MKLSQRLDAALLKLYKAYQDNALHPEDACRCAVGNILNQTDSWKHLSNLHGSLQLNYIGLVHEVLDKKFGGYKPSELMAIEKAFLEGCGYQTPLATQKKKPKNPTNRELLFDGLAATIEKLCALDGVENVLEITTAFEKIKASSKRREKTPSQ